MVKCSSACLTWSIFIRSSFWIFWICFCVRLQLLQMLCTSLLRDAAREKSSSLLLGLSRRRGYAFFVCSRSVLDAESLLRLRFRLRFWLRFRLGTEFFFYVFEGRPFCERISAMISCLSFSYSSLLLVESLDENQLATMPIDCSKACSII